VAVSVVLVSVVVVAVVVLLPRQSLWWLQPRRSMPPADPTT
jgi:hypothetical protein